MFVPLVAANAASWRSSSSVSRIVIRGCPLLMCITSLAFYHWWLPPVKPDSCFFCRILMNPPKAPPARRPSNACRPCRLLCAFCCLVALRCRPCSALWWLPAAGAAVLPARKFSPRWPSALRAQFASACRQAPSPALVLPAFVETGVLVWIFAGSAVQAHSLFLPCSVCLVSGWGTLWPSPGQLPPRRASPARCPTRFFR